MQNLIQFSNEFISSREIASITGKTHKNVLADCDKLNESYIKMSMAEISADQYLDTNNRKQREYILTKIQSLDLATGYSVELRIKVNRRWQELEDKQNATNTQIQIPQTFAEALKLAYEQQITIERLETRTKFVDVVFNSDELLTGAQVCKLLNLSYGNKTLYKNLREKGLFFKNRNEPKQLFVDKGYFRMKEVLIKDKVRIQTYFTQKGLGYIAKFLGVIIQPINTVRMID